MMIIAGADRWQGKMGCGFNEQDLYDGYVAAPWIERQLLSQVAVIYSDDKTGLVIDTRVDAYSFSVLHLMWFFAAMLRADLLLQ